MLSCVEPSPYAPVTDESFWALPAPLASNGNACSSVWRQAAKRRDAVRRNAALVCASTAAAMRPKPLVAKAAMSQRATLLRQPRCANTKTTQGACVKMSQCCDIVQTLWKLGTPVLTIETTQLPQIARPTQGACVKMSQCCDIVQTLWKLGTPVLTIETTQLPRPRRNLTSQNCLEHALQCAFRTPKISGERSELRLASHLRNRVINFVDALSNAVYRRLRAKNLWCKQRTLPRKPP